MPRVTRTPDESVIRGIKEAYARGQMLEALRRAEAFAPLREWGGGRPCVLAARIAVSCGAPRLSTTLTLRAFKADPTNPETLAQYGHELFRRRGPLALWELLRDWREAGPDATANQRALVLALKARAAADLRDFATAERLTARAESLGPSKPWIRLQRAHLLEQLDRVEEALETAKSAHSLHTHPLYRPATQACARLLQLLDRDQEAIDLLSKANAALQNGPLAAQLYALLSENGRWMEAEATLERYVALSPLIERPLLDWVTSQRARAAYHLGRRVDAARFAQELDDDFHKAFSKALSVSPVQSERVQLNVTFVRQHFKTCAPATLAALGRFWQKPAEHLQMAEAMCYDGTPHWQQREWAEQNGWCVRELRVTHKAAIALIERGIPFAISVVEATSAHMMAVIGFDRVRSTLLLRDPGQPYVVEVAANEFLQRYRAFGPHGMVFLPCDEQARMDGLSLPDAAVYDQHHQLWLALIKHHRAGAAETLVQMESTFKNHPIVWESRLALANYDSNCAEEARCLDRLLELFPNNPARLLQRLACLREGTRESRIQFLEQACSAQDADPALLFELASALEGDARTHPQARQALRRGLRFRPLDTRGLSAQASLCWEEGKLDEATELYRFAANLEGYREGLYQSWFMACRRTRRTNEAMAHLQDRFARFGARSEQPALTLAWAWGEMEQPARAREVLAQAAQLRPNDGYLLLRAASLFASFGDAAEVNRLLDAAKRNVRENDWLRAAAEAAEIRLDTKAALHWAREILRLEPLALDAHAGVARALARIEGPAAALRHLKAACSQFPHHYSLQRMLMEWTRDGDPAETEAAARELVRRAPSDAWARRELALALARSRHSEQALQEATEATRIEPRNSYSFSVLGHVYQNGDEPSKACEAFRRAVALSVDNRDAVCALLSLSQTDTERRRALAFVEQQLIQQVVLGDGVLAFLELARPVLEPQALLSSVRQAHSERPDLWHAWSALVSQLGHVGQLQEALTIAQQAAERFPHLPRIWLDLADVHRWRNEPEEEIRAAERAFDINPGWPQSALVLANALERRARLDEARQVYERALQHSPRDPQLHAYHAHVLWRQRQPESAYAAVEHALRLAPAYDWAWGLLLNWTEDSGEVSRAADFARVLARERPGEPEVWVILARVLAEPVDMQERLRAIERALELESHSTEAWDLKAESLACSEQFDEAIVACNEGAAACTEDIHILRGRHAWVEAQRRRLPEAIRLMREVLTDNSSYTWGWSQLVQWLIEEKQLPDATAALEQLLHLCPHDAWVNRQLGFLRLQQNDVAGAQKAFKAVLRLEPTDAYAARTLFDLLIQSNDLAGAAEVLRIMEMHQPGANTLAAEIQLSLQHQDEAKAISKLETVSALPDPDGYPVEAAADAFQTAGLTWRAVTIFRRALKAQVCNPQVAAAAVRLLAAKGKGRSALRLFMGLKPGVLQRRAATPMVQGLGRLRSGFLLRFLLWRRRAVLRADDSAWGQVGYVLSSFKRMRQVAGWLADWSARPNVQPWMLFNYCLALRHLGRYDEAHTVAQHVLEAWGHREGSADMRLFLAVEDAINGSISTAAEHLPLVVIREDVDHDLDLLTLSKTLVSFQQTPLAARRRAFQTCWKQLDARFSATRLMNEMKDIRRTFGRAGKVFARGGGGWRARLLFTWKLHWQWLLLLPYAALLLALVLGSLLG